MGKATPLKNISTAQYIFDKLVMALNKSIQLEREIDKARNSSKTYYGQLTTHPEDARKYDYDHRYDRNIGKKYITFL